jgi:hypothetical protein
MMKKNQEEIQVQGGQKRFSGRQVTSPYFDPVDTRILDSIRQARGKTPQESKLAGMVIKALLYRINYRDPHEARYIKGVLQTLVGAEAFILKYAPPLKENEEEIYEKHLTQICRAPTPRSGHMSNTIDIQKLLCTRFMENHQLPNTTEEEKLNWIETHWPQLIQFIGPFPCLCSYSVEWDKNTFCRLPLEEGMAGIIRMLLAYLHNTTPQNINKLLKQADPKLFRDSKAQK